MSEKNSNMLLSQEIEELLTRLDESVRWRPGAEGAYQDPHGALRRIRGRANHLVLGRRGSGKTRLLDELKRIATQEKDAYVISIGAEDYKRLTYPDILIQILRAFLREFIRILSPHYKAWSKEWIADRWHGLVHPIERNHILRRKQKLLEQLNSLNDQLDVLLRESEELEAEYEHSQEAQMGASASVKGDGVVGFDAAIEQSETYVGRKKASQREYKRTKVERLLADFKCLLSGVCEFLGGIVFLSVDDFYFIRREDQPAVIDYVHRICKDTNSYLKVATIKHRSNLYGKDAVLQGVVLGHEIQSINLELPLGNFDSISKFMGEIWNKICSEVGISEPMSLFKGDGFDQAVLASGGVPRDFFGVIKEAIKIARERNEDSVGKLRINEAARQYAEDTKFSELKVDLDANANEYELLLYDIVRFCRDQKRKNCFHVDVDQLNKNPDVHKLIDSLVDARLLHLITDNTSNSRREGRYAAYLLDVGLYAHPPRRGEQSIDEVKFWVRDDSGRLIHLQRSPVFPIRSMEDLRATARKINEESVSVRKEILQSAVSETTQNGGSHKLKQIDLLFPPTEAGD